MRFFSKYKAEVILVTLLMVVLVTPKLFIYITGVKNKRPASASSYSRAPTDSIADTVDIAYREALINDKDEIFDMTVGNALRTIAGRAGYQIQFSSQMDTNQLLRDNKKLYNKLFNFWIRKYTPPGLYIHAEDSILVVDNQTNNIAIDPVLKPVTQYFVY